MQIFRIDNFNRAHVSDTVMAKDIPTKGAAVVMADALIAKWGGEGSDSYYVIKEDGVAPYKYDPNA